VRTKTLVKGAVVQVDATPFRNWYFRRYDIYLGKKKKVTEKKDKEGKVIEKKEKKPVSAATQKLRRHRAGKRAALSAPFELQFRAGRLLAQLTSRPGQVGRADGILLEGAALAFYQRKLEKKKRKAAAAH
jgi:small subunit ribosomal protein S8e